MATPTTRYARSGDATIAYQVAGDGPFDLIRVPGWISKRGRTRLEGVPGEWQLYQVEEG